MQIIDLSDYLTSEELAARLGIARTTIQRRAARGDLTPDVIAPHGVLYWHPSRVFAEAQPP